MNDGKLSVKGLSIAFALLWGGGVLMVGIGNLVWPDYGTAFLKGIASIYPGYHGTPDIRSVLIGASYAFVDGAVGGFLLALFYNLFSKKS